MYRLNFILFILVAASVVTAFADEPYKLQAELIQVESMLDVEDLMCIDDCGQELLIQEAFSINKAITHKAK